MQRFLVFQQSSLTLTASSATVGAASLLSSSNSRSFSTFHATGAQMETQQPTTGAPRGLVNRMSSLGLPPWAAWTRNLNNHAMYRLSGATRTSFLPKYDFQMEHIWLNENVRERVRSVKDKQYIMRQLKYPYTLTGVWYSDALDHWIQLPHVKAAQYAIEKDGGFDNFVLKRPGPELRSTYGERLRRHILARQREIEKNFVLQKSAEKLAAKIFEEAMSAKGGSAVVDDEVLKKYGITRAEVVESALEMRAR